MRYFLASPTPCEKHELGFCRSCAGIPYNHGMHRIRTWEGSALELELMRWAVERSTGEVRQELVAHVAQWERFLEKQSRGERVSWEEA